jgi:ribonucleotide reductase alpha subunit
MHKITIFNDISNTIKNAGDDTGAQISAMNVFHLEIAETLLI